MLVIRYLPNTHAAIYYSLKLEHLVDPNFKKIVNVNVTYIKDIQLETTHITISRTPPDLVRISSYFFLIFLIHYIRGERGRDAFTFYQKESKIYSKEEEDV